MNLNQMTRMNKKESVRFLISGELDGVPTHELENFKRIFMPKFVNRHNAHMTGWVELEGPQHHDLLWFVQTYNLGLRMKDDTKGTPGK